MEDIKHEVVVNYLFQQQCSALWVGDGCGTTEGIVLRKSRGNYLTCPPQLIDSEFGMACDALNVQVCYHPVHFGPKLTLKCLRPQ